MAPAPGHRQVIDALLAFYGKRQARILDLLAGGPRTAFEVVTAIFPRARPGDTFLTLSEELANLEVLEMRGQARRLPDELPYRFCLPS